MKKFLLIGLITALVLIIVGGAGVVYARVRGTANNPVVTVIKPQVGDTILRPFRNGPGGMMGGNGLGYGPGGMMGERSYGFGPGMMGRLGRDIARGKGIMHDYMISAFADAVGLTIEQVDTRLANGESLKDIAIAQGTTTDTLPELAAQVRQAALDKAVADGVITQAQADRMLERMNKSPGLGFGDCPIWDGDDIQQP
jgi:hypothetical protein